MKRTISLKEAECRKYTAGSYWGMPGRSSIKVECPFCHNVFKVYVWSLAGSGKRCTNEDCRAIHTSFGLAYDDYQNHKKEEVENG
jgi:hypothetical protein